MTDGSLRLVVADDHPLFRTGLGYALRAQGLEIVGEAADGRQAVELCRRHRPAVALLDARMPVMDGIAACRLIVAELPEVTVVVLTTFTEPGLVRSVVQAGARGFLNKDADAAQIAGTVRALAANLALTRFPAIELPALSSRESEVLRLLVSGMTYKEMAQSMRLSPETVKDYVSNIYRKLDVDDRFEAAGRARSLGLA